MAITVAVIGLNWKSVSTLLALGRHDFSFNLRAWDADVSARIAADKLTGINHVDKKLRDTVKDANIILCGLPISEKETFFKELALVAKRDAILVNITPHFGRTQQLFNELISDRFITTSLFPVIRTKFLVEENRDIENAQPDLFDKSRCYIADPGNMGSAVMDLADDLSVLLGTKAVITSPAELDGLVSSTSIFPKLIGSAAMLTLAGKSGWREGQYISEIPAILATNILEEVFNVDEFAELVFLDNGSLMAVMDEYLRKLIEIREAISMKDQEKIAERISDAINTRIEWLSERDSQSDKEISLSSPAVKNALKRIQNLDR